MSDAEGSDEEFETEEGGEGGHASGGNFITDASPPTAISISEFEPSEQEFLNRLQEAHPSATPVKEHGNEILVWMGEYDLSEYAPNFDQDTAEVYMLIPNSFPNCDPHWILTAPALTVNDQSPDVAMDANTFTADHGSHGEKVEIMLEVSEDHETGRAWSWRWSNADLEPEEVDDIKRAPVMVDSQLNHMEQRQ